MFVHVHGDDTKLLAEVADAWAQLDIRNQASAKPITRLRLRRNCGAILPPVETGTPRRRHRISHVQNALLLRHNVEILEANARCA